MTSRAALPTVAGYDVVAPLSRGGMGNVLLAKKRGAHGFERLVALKTIRGELEHKGDMRAMFLDEARLLGRLHHPAVTEVYDLIEQDGALCLAMEYVRGVSFSRLIELRPPPEIAAAAIAAALRGLHAAHELADAAGEPLGVVHRDVSPQNLMIAFDGRVKILDFGIAFMRRRLAPVAEYGAVKGKPAYMAPEQLRNDAVDRRSDVFAASLVLHELLTGERVAAGDSPYEVAHALAIAPIAPPSAKAGPLPADLDSIVMRGLERDPADRYPTAEAMASALERAVAEIGGEGLDAFVRRALAAERERHDAALAAAIAGLDVAADGAAPPGRATGVSTAVGPAAPAGAEAPRRAAEEDDRALVEVPSPDVAPSPPRPNPRGWSAAGGLMLLVALGIGAVWLLRGAGAVPDGERLAPSELASPAPSADPPPAASSAGTPLDSTGAPLPSSAIAPEPSLEPRARQPARASAALAASSAPPAGSSPPSPSAASSEPGFITIGAEPYALVVLDGTSIGPTPIFKRRVSAGPHTVVLTTPDTGQVRLSRSVEVEPGRTREVIAR